MSGELRTDAAHAQLIEASVKLRLPEDKGGVRHVVAEGDGPVGALDAALRKALDEAYPSLRELSLVDYKVRVVNGAEAGTSASIRVIVESLCRATGDIFSTIGVSTNIIEVRTRACCRWAAGSRRTRAGRTVRLAGQVLQTLARSQGSCGQHLCEQRARARAMLCLRIGTKAEGRVSRTLAHQIYSRRCASHPHRHHLARLCATHSAGELGRDRRRNRVEARKRRQEARGVKRSLRRAPSGGLGCDRDKPPGVRTALGATIMTPWLWPIAIAKVCDEGEPLSYRCRCARTFCSSGCLSTPCTCTMNELTLGRDVRRRARLRRGQRHGLRARVAGRRDVRPLLWSMRARLGARRALRPLLRRSGRRVLQRGLRHERARRLRCGRERAAPSRRARDGRRRRCGYELSRQLWHLGRAATASVGGGWRRRERRRSLWLLRADGGLRRRDDERARAASRLERGSARRARSRLGLPALVDELGRARAMRARLLHNLLDGRRRRRQKPLQPATRQAAARARASAGDAAAGTRRWADQGSLRAPIPPCAQCSVRVALVDAGCRRVRARGTLGARTARARSAPTRSQSARRSGRGRPSRRGGARSGRAPG